MFQRRRKEIVFSRQKRIKHWTLGIFLVFQNEDFTDEKLAFGEHKKAAILVFEFVFDRRLGDKVLKFVFVFDNSG